MSNIASSDARALFTKMLLDKYKERVEVKGFLRSFFPEKIEMTKELSIEVQRGKEKIAVDVIRGSIGNRNTFSQSSEKIFVPPHHREYFDATELSLYDRLWGSTSIDDGVFTALLEQVAEKQGELQSKIERAHELQCAEVLETGIVTYNKGVSVDFHRKAAMKVDKGGGNYWATGTVNPYDDLAAGAKLLRQNGKAQGGKYNVIMGETAFADFMDNDVVKARADIRNFSLDSIREPQRNSTGASLQGNVVAGSYSFDIWTYPEFYDNASNVSTPYLNDKKVIILPLDPRFKFGFAAVPQLATVGGVTKGKFLFGDYIDKRKSTHEFDVKSCGLAIPVAVDQIYTLQVVA